MRKAIIVMAVLVSGIILTYGQQPEKVSHLNLEDRNLALEGYDPVSYFKAGGPKKGDASIFTEEAGVRYNFSSQSNKEAFLKQPDAYKPQYGGWCAYAMGAKGEKVEVDPETFKIIDGKLYLFYNRFFTNTLETWTKNETVLRTNADKNWQKLIWP